MTKEEKIGQLFFPAVFIHDTEAGIREIETLIKNHCVGGLTFFYSRESVETNFDRKKTVTQHLNSVAKLKEMVAHYQQLSKYPLLISIDAEWGLGMRIAAFPAFPYLLTLSATNNEYLIFEVGKAIAQELKSVGIHQNLAPVVDINNNPKNPVIGYRSFGEHREVVVQNAWAYYQGMQSENILGCLKHFPGHGDTAVDSHLGLPVLNKSVQILRENELFPFNELIKKGIDCIMTGHLAVPQLSGNQLPASICKEMIDFLRTDLAYQGAIITDALNMKGVASEFEAGELELKALEAGNDMLSFSKNIAKGIALIGKKVSEERIEESFQKIQRLKEKAGLFSSLKNTPKIVDENTHYILRNKIAESAITSVKRTDKGINNSKKNVFISLFKKIEDSVFAQGISYPKYAFMEGNNLSDLTATLAAYDNLIIALYVPSMKPLNHFGLSDIILNFIEKTAQEKSVTLYLFGNPYTLKLLPPVECFLEVIIMHQYLPELEAAALQYFEGNLEAKGQLPIQL